MINEVLRTADEPKKILQKADVRKEAEEMVKRHELQLTKLKDSSGGDSKTFDNAVLTSTKLFQQGLEDFLKKHEAEYLYEEVVAPVRDQLKKILKDHLVSSSQ